MKNFDATDELVECVCCAVCEKQVRGGKWFSRLKAEELLVALCCPLCHETFLRGPVAYMGRIRTLTMTKQKNKP